MDSLKLVNDRDGHHAGDAHIRQAARAILETTRDSDVVPRLGGDEFGILAAHTNSREAQHLVDRLSAQLTRAGTPGSIGHAPYTVISGFPGAWQNADAAMYEQNVAAAQQHAPQMPQIRPATSSPTAQRLSPYRLDESPRLPRKRRALRVAESRGDDDQVVAAFPSGH